MVAYNKAMLREYVQPLFNTRDGHITCAYDAYKPFALTDPRHPIFWKGSVAYFGDLERLNFIDAYAAMCSYAGSFL